MNPPSTETTPKTNKPAQTVAETKESLIKKLNEAEVNLVSM